MRTCSQLATAVLVLLNEVAGSAHGGTDADTCNKRRHRLCAREAGNATSDACHVMSCQHWLVKLDVVGLVVLAYRGRSARSMVCLVQSIRGDKGETHNGVCWLLYNGHEHHPEQLRIAFFL